MALKAPFSSSTLTHKRSKATAQGPAPTPAPDLRRQLFGRDSRTCGVPEGYYTDVAPVCSGSASLCTFTGSSGYQGCCQDESPDYCTFYTTCYAYSEQASCTGSCRSSALVCPSSAPQCTQYAYQWEPNPPASHWTGFGCGLQTAIIYAYAVNGIEQSQSTATASSDPSLSTKSASSGSGSSLSTFTSSTRSQPTESTSQSSLNPTILPPPTGSGLASTTLTTSARATSSLSAINQSVSPSHTHTGAIAGGVVGGLAAFAFLLIAFITWRIYIKKRERRNMAPMRQRELGQPVNIL